MLDLKAARGWSHAQAARAFLVEPDTIAAWLKRIDEGGSSGLVQLREPSRTPARPHAARWRG